MEYDSVLDQQSISGKNVSLILYTCVEAWLYEIRSQLQVHNRLNCLVQHNYDTKFESGLSLTIVCTS